MDINDESFELIGIKKKRSTKIKKRLLKKAHTNRGVKYPVGTPLENLKASDSTIEFLEKREII